MTEQQEKKNSRIAAFTSLAVHALLFLIFIFVIAWRAPNPPLPEYGIELNFGSISQGSGEVQPVTPAAMEEPAVEEQQQQADEQPDDETTPANNDKSLPDESETVEQPVLTKQESPVTVKEQKKETPRPVEKPIEKPKEKTESKTDVVPKETESKSTAAADKSTTTEKDGKPVSQGDKANKTGDQGDPKGVPDAKAMYGTQGGGDGGPGLDLAGWTWDYIPKPNVPNNESGRVEFEIKVNAEGEIQGIQVIGYSVSPEALRACREAIERLTFTKTDGRTVPPISTGRITFVIRAK